MKTLILGAGPLGSLYAHLLYQAGKDVTILARGERYDFIDANGVVLVDELTGTKVASTIPVVNSLDRQDAFDLVVVLIRKNKLTAVFEILREATNIGNILFMGNNALGFDKYLEHLSREKLLFGFPGAGGGIRDQIVHYADREDVKVKRMPITIGEIDGRMRDRTKTIISLFDTSGIPVKLTKDIDGWLKYHVALISPIVGGLYKHNCDNYAFARDDETIRIMVRAAKEGGRILNELGYTRRQPFRFNLFYWLPEAIVVKIFQGLLGSRFAEIAYAMHANTAKDEMRELASEFQSLIEKASIKTPNIDKLRAYVS